MESRTMVYEEQEAVRQERLNEPGTELPCPFCHVSRVKRSDYIRCNRCGMNWMEGEDLSKDPRNQRYQDMLRTASTKTAKGNGAQTATSTFELSRDR